MPKGFLVRYAVGGDGGPAAVLVHGFGTSCDQWRHQFTDLARDHRVYAVDLLGFGHAEKPALAYTADLWTTQIAAFGLEVVGGPFVLVGNSIGGYLALAAAARLGPGGHRW